MNAPQVPILIQCGNLAALQGLDEVAEQGVNCAQLTECINCMQQGKSAFVVAHQVHWWCRYCHRQELMATRA